MALDVVYGVTNAYSLMNDYDKFEGKRLFNLWLANLGWYLNLGCFIVPVVVICINIFPIFCLFALCDKTVTNFKKIASDLSCHNETFHEVLFSMLLEAWHNGNKLRCEILKKKTVKPSD